jgi:LysM repeat protein/ABC-type branched-subunit amino acid transport system substrate-binding protein
VAVIGHGQYNADTVVVNGNSYVMHTVEKGQTLFSLAKYYNSTVDDLVAQNPEAESGLRIGQVLKIKIEAQVLVSAPTTASYVVKSGDTLFSIAKYFGVTAEELRKLNNGMPSGLLTGDTILVPANAKVNPNIQSAPAKQMKDDVYDIALMLPFYADYKDTMETRDFRLRDAALQLYRGAMLAADSLERNGLKARVHVYDVLDNKTMLRGILRKEEMKRMDLIIGPLFKDLIIEVSDWCNANDVHMVVPVQQPNRILLNAVNMSKSVSGSATQWMSMARYVAGKYTKENVLLVDSKILDDRKVIDAFKEEWFRLKQDSLKNVVVFNDAASFNLDGKLPFGKCAVIVPTADKKVIATVFKALGNRDVEVFGLESWDNMDAISTADRNRYHVHFPQNTFINYADEDVQQWIENYRTKYKSEPSSFAFVGYDIMLYYGRGLRQFGVDFPNHFAEMNGDYLATRFDVFRASKDSGFENAGINIIRTDNYQLMHVN